MKLTKKEVEKYREILARVSYWLSNKNIEPYNPEEVYEWDSGYGEFQELLKKFKVK